MRSLHDVNDLVVRMAMNRRHLTASARSLDDRERAGSLADGLAHERRDRDLEAHASSLPDGTPDGKRATLLSQVGLAEPGV